MSNITAAQLKAFHVAYANKSAKQQKYLDSHTVFASELNVSRSEAKNLAYLIGHQLATALPVQSFTK